MRLNWTRENTLGLLIGIASPLVFLPILLYVLSLTNGNTVEYLWDQMLYSHEVRSKYLSLALISNLIWFYIFLNRAKYEYTQGIILGLLCYAPYMVYVNLIR